MSSISGDAQLSRISMKLDVLIRLSALSLIKDIKLQKDQIVALSRAGFAPKEIAEVLGTTSNTVSVALTSVRREWQKKESDRTSQPESEAAEIDDELKSQIVRKKKN